MRTPSLTRRQALRTAAASATSLIACAAPGTATSSPTTPPGKTGLAEPELVPLPFDPAALRGLSERMIVSHHRNNYGGAVRNLGKVQAELTALRADAPGFVVAALRERELTFRNSKSLHEAYFGNLGGDGKRSSSVESLLAESFGSAGAWEQQFRATAMGLAGGSGWVVLSFELDTGRLRNVGSGHHTQVQAFSVPLFVLDMYEHAYHIDFGAEAARYVDAFFANANWDEVDRRVALAQRMAASAR